MKKFSIAIDGPAGAGKSTVARHLAHSLCLRYLDTGAMYRAVTYLAVKRKIDMNNGQALAELAASMDFGLDEESQITLEGQALGEEIRTPEVTRFVSLVSSHVLLRDIIVAKQQLMAESGGIVMDGRDIGTSVMKSAELKIFLTADIGERARRRFVELAAAGHAVSMDQLVQQIEDRDFLDSTRTASPLRPAEDAIMLDTTSLTTSEVVEEIIAILKLKLGESHDV